MTHNTLVGLITLAFLCNISAFVACLIGRENALNTKEQRRLARIALASLLFGVILWPATGVYYLCKRDGPLHAFILDVLPARTGPVREKGQLSHGVKEGGELSEANDGAN